MIIIFIKLKWRIENLDYKYSNYLLKNNKIREPIYEMFVMFSKTMKIENLFMNCL